MLIALVGCSSDDDVIQEEETGPVDEVIAAASFTLESPASNTFAWVDGSRVSIFRSNVNERFAYSAAEDQFKKEDKLKKGEAFENVYGVYPYKGANRVTNGEIKTEIPAAQQYSADGVNFANAPMVGMSASASSTDIAFKNLCGYAVVKLYGTAVVKSVAITDNSGNALAGVAMAEIAEDGEPTFDIVASQNNTVTLTAATPVPLGATVEEATPFYLIVPPTTLEAGFIVTVVDSYGNVRKKNFKVDEENPAYSISRNEAVTIAKYELAEKKPLQTILDVQFNEDGTATDAGIYGLDVNLVGDINPYSYVYKHSKFKENNIARFGHIVHNDAGKKYSYYKVDYSANEKMKATIADGFSMEIVTLSPAFSYDWWSCPVGSDAFRIYRKGHMDGNEMWFNWNSDGAWWPTNGNASAKDTNAVFEKDVYTHTILMYDADNQSVSVYNNGVLVGLAEGVANFKPGRWLTIGGYVESAGNDLFMQWNGEIALVKMYDQAMTPEEVADKYNALKLPDASAAPAAPAFSNPLFDVKFKEDKTAENSGSMASLTPTYYPNSETSVVNVDGFGYVANFNLPIRNDPAYTDGFYRIDYSDNDDFKNKLRDGFTLEVVCLSNFDQGQFWMRPVSSNKWGFMMRDGGHKRWATYANHGDNSWGANGRIQAGGYHVYWNTGNKYWPAVTKHESFTHILYVYNAEAKEFGTYVDGNFNGGHYEENFDVGSMFHINGFPYVRGIEMAHGWNGKVAVVRIFDEAITQDQAIERYNAMKPTIQTLNTVIQ